MESISHSPIVESSTKKTIDATGLDRLRNLLYSNELKRTDEKINIRISPRNDTNEKTASLCDAVADSVVFAWWEKDPVSFYNAVENDPELHNTLNAISEFSTSADSLDSEPYKGMLRGYALIELTASLEILGQIHLTKDQINELQRFVNQRNKGLGLNEGQKNTVLEITDKLRGYGRNLWYYIIPTIWLAVLQKSAADSVEIEPPSSTVDTFQQTTPVESAANPINELPDIGPDAGFSWDDLLCLVPAAAIGVAAGAYLRSKLGGSATADFQKSKNTLLENDAGCHRQKKGKL